MAKIAELEKAYRENPDTPMFAQLADSYLDKGSVDQALKLCEEGCESFPDYPSGFAVLSRCYEAQDKLEDARQAMDHALRLDPENPGGYFRLSQLYESLGIGTLALKSLQQAASLDPFNDYLAELVEELTAAVGDDPEEGEPAAEPGDEAPAAEVPLPEPAASASPGQVAAQAVMQEYPDGAVTVETAGMEKPVPEETSSPFNTSASDTATAATDAIPSPSEAAVETPLEVTLTPVDVEAGTGEGSETMAGLPPDLLQPDAGAEAEDQGLIQDNPPTAEPAQAVELISLEDTAAETDIDAGSGAVELISFDGEEWEVDPTTSDAMAEPAPDADTLFEYETQDVVAAANSGPEGDADLVDLFHEIEGHPAAAEPTPPPAAETETADDDDDKRATTETLAQIYASQGLIQRAVDTYRQLLDRDPDNAHLRQQLAELEQQSDETV